MELAQENIQGYLRISKRYIKISRPHRLIAVRAVGQSLNKANIGGDNIEDGNYVIIDCKQQPNDSGYVLSIIDRAANFKKFFKDDKKHEIRLVSESTQEFHPIILHKSDMNASGYTVNGVVVRVVKN